MAPNINTAATTDNNERTPLQPYGSLVEVTQEAATQLDGKTTTRSSNDKPSSGLLANGGPRRPLSRSNSGRSTNSRTSHVLIKTQTSFYQDARTFAEGSIPHSLAIGTVIGIVCGVAAYIYYSVLFWALEFVWHTLPEKLVVPCTWWPESLYFMWIPLVGCVCALEVGVTVVYIGEPGDLPYTVKCVHDQAYVAMSHVFPMVCASFFSIVGGGSLGPEAPLVAICAALGGFVSRSIFQQTNRNIIRKHTLMGMAGALAAFFGCPLGGSLFALEVNSRFGVEYFEHAMEAIFSGVICVTVFRQLADLPLASIWVITSPPLDKSTALEVVYGILLGFVGAGVAFVFANLHWKIMELFKHFHLLSNEKAIHRAMVASVVVVGLGVLIPHTMFWGEDEIQTIATLSKAETLPHIWPTYGLTHFENNGPWHCLLIGFAKILAISFTVAGGYRGGFIFPLMATGAAFGRCLHFLFPFIPVQLCVLCMAAAINVGITRTAMATTLILSYLAGEQNAMAPLIASSLIALFTTGYMPFIRSQVLRSDLECLVDEEGFDFDDEESAIHPKGPFLSIPVPDHPHDGRIPTNIVV